MVHGNLALANPTTTLNVLDIWEQHASTCDHVLASSAKCDVYMQATKSASMSAH